MDEAKKVINDKELQEGVKELIENLESEYAAESELIKLRYLLNEYWDEVEKRRQEAVDEANVLSNETDYFSKLEFDSLRSEIRTYDKLFQNKQILKRTGYETYMKYIAEREVGV